MKQKLDITKLLDECSDVLYVKATENVLCILDKAEAKIKNGKVYVKVSDFLNNYFGKNLINVVMLIDKDIHVSVKDKMTGEELNDLLEIFNAELKSIEASSAYDYQEDISYDIISMRLTLK